jgi:hypothetical protein
MNRVCRPAINDINRCLEDAHSLARQITHTRRSDRSLYSAFASLAGNEQVGFLAYVIWRSRSQLYSNLRWTGAIRYDAETRARHTRPYMARGKCCLR